MSKLYIKSRAEWRKWLEKNHLKEKEVYVVYYRKETAKTCASYDETVEEALCFGWIDGIINKLDAESYTRRFTPRKPNSAWSKYNIERVEKMIELGKMTDVGLEKVEHAKANGQWDNAYRLSDEQKVPDDLKKALMKNKAAWDHFQNKYSNTDRFTVIYRVNVVKSPVLRAEKIKKAVELAKQGKKPNQGNKPLL